MNTGGITLAIAAFALSSCEKSASPPGAKSIAVTVPAATTSEPDLQELSPEEKRLKREADMDRLRVQEIQDELPGYEKKIAATRKNVTDLTAVREQMQTEAEKLKSEWEKELEGVGEGSPVPVAENHRRNLDEMARLLEENQELKRKLAEGGR